MAITLSGIDPRSTLIDSLNRSVPLIHDGKVAPEMLAQPRFASARVTDWTLKAEPIRLLRSGRQVAKAATCATQQEFVT